MLARASVDLGSTLNYTDTISHVCNVSVPILAEWSALFIIDEKLGTLSFTHAYHPDQQRNKKLTEFFQSDLDNHLKRPVVLDTLRKGRAVVEIREVPSPIAGFLLNLPLIQRSEVVGFLTLGSKNNFTPDDILMAEEIANRAATALDNSRLYQRACIAESESAHAKKIADNANLAKSKFLANMSHEIRTPIGAILGFTDLLMSPDSSEADRMEWARRVKYNGNHLLRLLSDILNLTKVESGQLSIEKQIVNFNQFFNQIALNLSTQAQVKNLELCFLLESSVPSSFYTDPTRLQQILTNVIGNALKFTDEGKINVSAGFNKESGALYFNIEDTGPGLTVKQASQLFQPFVQTDAEHSRRCGGTGLGLALSMNLAQLLDGDLKLVYSEPGRGTKFKIYITPEVPANVEFLTELQHPTFSSDYFDSQKEILRRLTGKKFLVVDDSLDNQYLTKTLLTSKGATVSIAGSGEEALREAQSDNFDIILMDIQMPGKDGYSTTKELRQRGFKKPIVALTACALTEEREKSTLAGFNRHLTKPINQNELMSVLLDLLVVDEVLYN